MDEHISWWFPGLEAGLETLPEDAPFFRACAENCLSHGTLELYKKLQTDTGGTPDAFFTALGQLEGVDAEILESGLTYRLIFKTCTCTLHGCGYVNTPALCRCSRASILRTLEVLWPNHAAAVEIERTILGGAAECSFRISLRQV